MVSLDNYHLKVDLGLIIVLHIICDGNNVMDGTLSLGIVRKIRQMISQEWNRRTKNKNKNRREVEVLIT